MLWGGRVARRVKGLTCRKVHCLAAYVGATRRTSALSIGVSWSPPSRKPPPLNRQVHDESRARGRRKSVSGLDDDEQAAGNASITRVMMLMESAHHFCGNRACEAQVCAPLFICKAALSNAPACSRLEAFSSLPPLRLEFLSLTPPNWRRVRASWGSRAQRHRI